MAKTSNYRKSVLKSNHLTKLIISTALVSVLVAGCSDSSGKNSQQKNKLIPAVEAVKSGDGALPLV